MKTKEQITTRIKEIEAILENKASALSGDQRDKLKNEETALWWVIND